MVQLHFPFFPYFNRTFCKPTVKILSRHLIIRHLIWVYTVCPCPIKSILGLYGLSCHMRFWYSLDSVAAKVHPGSLARDVSARKHEVWRYLTKNLDIKILYSISGLSKLPPSKGVDLLAHHGCRVSMH